MTNQRKTDGDGQTAPEEKTNGDGTEKPGLVIDVVYPKDKPEIERDPKKQN